MNLIGKCAGGLLDDWTCMAVGPRLAGLGVMVTDAF